MQRIWDDGKTAIFDVDVVGGISIKKQYPKECLSFFIMPPSIEVLRERLRSRDSESDEMLKKRINKAEEEILRNNEFDRVILNNNFEIACKEAKRLIIDFIKS